MGEPLNGTYEFEGRICASQREKLWYYLDEERAQLGPMSFQALTQAVHQGLVTPSTYLWNEELDQWTTLGELTIRTPPAEFSTSSP